MIKISSAELSAKITSEQFKSKVYEVCPEFVIDENNRNIINELWKYSNEESTKYDKNKGILLWGDIGTGKTTIIKIIGEVLRIKGKGFKTINCANLATQFAAKGLEALNCSTYNESGFVFKPVNRAFDELGREPIPAKHYGNELNVMQYIFQARYELRNDIKTFATTNINPDKLFLLYGDYISDRILEMFNIIEIKGNSRR